MTGRNIGTDFAYNFNGKRTDKWNADNGSYLDFDLRMYDARLGRFMSHDFIAGLFPDLSPYQFASNNPILNIDLDGLEGENANKIVFEKATGTRNVFIVINSKICGGGKCDKKISDAYDFKTLTKGNENWDYVVVESVVDAVEWTKKYVEKHGTINNLGFRGHGYHIGTKTDLKGMEVTSTGSKVTNSGIKNNTPDQKDFVDALKTIAKYISIDANVILGNCNLGRDKGLIEGLYSIFHPDEGSNSRLFFNVDKTNPFNYLFGNGEATPTDQYKSGWHVMDKKTSYDKFMKHYLTLNIQTLSKGKNPFIINAKRRFSSKNKQSAVLRMKY